MKSFSAPTVGPPLSVINSRFSLKGLFNKSEPFLLKVMLGNMLTQLLLICILKPYKIYWSKVSLLAEFTEGSWLVAIPYDRAGDAQPKLKFGEGDAMFYVAGYPVKLCSENLSVEDNLAFRPFLKKKHH